MKKKHLLLAAVTLLAVFLSACTSPASAPEGLPAPEALPAPSEDGQSMFAVDKNINMTTIDQYVGRDDVAYRDVRMLFDPADYAAIGGDADLSRTITGFKIVPYPYIATMQSLPVSGAYAGNTLFTVEWAADGTVASATANYEESERILAELFPKDKAIFLMCGGGGYANMLKQLLLHYGWDAQLLYNIGGNWEYTGDNTLELIVYPEDAAGNKIYATWRADYAYIDFEKLNPIGSVA